jgi:predicted AlkP superfamily phosphohydrolase/phosphomutase
MPKVLVIGLDGGTLDLVLPWVEQGELPVLASLMETGQYAALKSVIPVLSSAAWASFMTGMNPGKHGLIDFVRREQDSYRLRLLNRTHMRGASLWQMLSEQSKRVIVVNVPMTYPPEEVNGLIVSGLGTPDFKPFTFPPQLGDQLRSRGYKVNKSVVFKPGNEDAFIQEAHQMADQTTETALWLMGENEWDFFMLVYRDTDEMPHFFWRYMDSNHPEHDPSVDSKYKNAILDYYKNLDTAIGKLVDAAGPGTTTMIISDHGMGPLYKDVHLNEWLRQKGYLETHSPEAQLQGAIRVLAQLGLTRSNISATLRRLKLGSLETKIKDYLGDRIEILPRTQRADFPNAIDWSLTRAYSFGYHGQIYINLAGREPEGIVKPGEEFDNICHQIELGLKNLIDPADGKPVVDEIFTSDEIFSGPCIEYAPDLTVVMRNLSYITRKGYEFGEQPGQVLSAPQTNESGSHRYLGMLIMSGDKAVEDGSNLPSPVIYDLAPTILHLLGCPVDPEMDGHVLKDWISTNYPVKTGNYLCMEENLAPKNLNLSDQDEREVMERLKSLGYLE